MTKNKDEKREVKHESVGAEESAPPTSGCRLSRDEAQPYMNAGVGTAVELTSAYVVYLESKKELNALLEEKRK